jgi:hypothetical protein
MKPVRDGWTLDGSDDLDAFNAEFASVLTEPVTAGRTCCPEGSGREAGSQGG